MTAHPRLGAEMVRLGLAFALLTGLLAAVPTSAGAAVAPGCTSTRPTFVGGTLRGYPDNRYVNAAVGVEIDDAHGRKITPGGAPINVGGYSWVEVLNPTTPPTGTTDPAGVTDRWGQCVAAAATVAYIEVYPKRPSPAPMATDFSRYGEIAYYHGRVTAGGRNLFTLRLPTTYQAAAGNTGGVQGYIWYSGHNVSASAITRVRAFTYQPGSACGVEGLAAGANVLGSATGPNRTYYKVDYLAAGQCGAPYQLYSLQMTCTNACGAASKSITITVAVRRGVWPRVDVTFR